MKKARKGDPTALAALAAGAAGLSLAAPAGFLTFLMSTVLHRCVLPSAMLDTVCSKSNLVSENAEYSSSSVQSENSSLRCYWSNPAPSPTVQPDP